jgi:hypothetical protein
MTCAALAALDEGLWYVARHKELCDCDSKVIPVLNSFRLEIYAWRGLL